MPALEHPQHEAFARFVAQGKKNKDAAIAAGYTTKYASSKGSKLAKDAKIRQRIAELQQSVAEVAVIQTAVTRDWVVDTLKKNVERALQTVPVLNRQGKPTGEFQYDGAVVNKALELLGKHIGMWPRAAEQPQANAGRVVIGLPDEDEPTETKPLNADALRTAGKSLSVQ